MKPTTHEVLPEEVMALRDGELSREREIEVRAHLNECIVCQEVASQMDEAWERASVWEVDELSDGSARRMRSAIARAKESKGLRFPRKAPVLTLASAALAMLFLMATPNLMRSRMAANEASAVGSLHTINGAASTYLQRYGRYPAALRNFGPAKAGEPNEEAAGLIDGVLAAGTKSGYKFIYRELSENLGRPAYRVDAAPVDPGKTGTRHFWTDESGAIRDESGQPLGEGTSQTGAGAGASVQAVARTAELRIRVENLETAREAVKKLLAVRHGYITEFSSEAGDDDVRYARISLRVPRTELDMSLNDLRGVGRVVGESETGENVQPHREDLAARLKTARETEGRIIAIIGQRTGNVADVLEAEKEGARVRQEIEQMEAQQEILAHKVEMAMIELSIREEYGADSGLTPNSATGRLKAGLRTGCKDALKRGFALLLWVTEVGPTLLLWVVILALPSYWARRKWRSAESRV